MIGTILSTRYREGKSEEEFRNYKPEANPTVAWVRKFNAYDLYSKGRPRPDKDAVLPFYQDLMSEFFTDRIAW